MLAGGNKGKTTRGSKRGAEGRGGILLKLIQSHQALPHIASGADDHGSRSAVTEIQYLGFVKNDADRKALGQQNEVQCRGDILEDPLPSG